MKINEHWRDHNHRYTHNIIDTPDKAKYSNHDILISPKNNYSDKLFAHLRNDMQNSVLPNFV